MLLATWLRGISNVIFEPNAEPGLTNKLLARLANQLRPDTKFPRKRGDLRGSNRMPRTPGILCNRAAKTGKALPPARNGGSQGALPINRTFMEAAEFLAKRKAEIQIVHETGERDYNNVRAAYARDEIRWKSRPSFPIWRNVSPGQT